MTTEWQWRPAPRKTTFDSLFHPDEKFCFLAGSGISLDPPSCLPTGYQFTRTVLEQLVPREELTAILTLMDPEREGMRDPGDFLRFEQLMEYLHSWHDPELRVLDCLAECTVPNFNHLFLAQMIIREHPVLTTNFDSLIEQALLKAGTRHDNISPVIHRKDWQARLKKASRVFKRENYHVHKLHGSLVDFRNDQDCRESLQATLVQIASGKGDTFLLESWKQQVVQSILQQHDIIVLGYSGLDDFDVLPTLWVIPSSKRVLWISHDSGRSLDQALIEVVQPGEPSQAQHREVDRTSQNLIAFIEYRTRQPSQLVRITVNTGQLLEWLWQRYIQQPFPSFLADLDPCAEEKRAKPVQLMLSESERWILAGKIYADRNLPGKSLQIYQRALTLARDGKELKQQSTCLNNIGIILEDQGRLDDALKHYQEALDIDERREDQQGKAICLNNMGILLENQGRLDDALKHYQEALAIAEKIRDLRVKVTCLNSIGGLLHFQSQLDDALKHFQEALAIDEQLGDLHGKQARLNNIGAVLKEQWQLNDALKHYQEALAIAEQLGNLKGKIPTINNIGSLLCTQERLDEALKYFQEALTIAERFGSLREKATQLNNIGRLFSTQRRLDEAIKYHEEALAIDEQLDDLQGKSHDLVNIGGLLRDQGQLDEALRHFREALSIDERLGDQRGKAYALTNIGHVLELKGDMDRALKQYQEVLVIAEKLKEQGLTDLNLLYTVKHLLEKFDKDAGES